MKHFNLFIELIRIKKPIGFMLLFWPCTWGLTLAFDFNTELNKFFFYLILFFFGSILMRSAGCIINDIADKDFDKRVQRTKNRPIASNKVSVKLGFIYAAVLCIFAFFVLIQFNTFTIILALGSMPLAFSYPLMKRYTYWPQLFLGITFNYGIILGWSSVNGSLDLIVFLLYVAAIFWTLGYDTIYGYQDIEDDEIIGVKSTSIKFKSNPKLFLSFCYLIFVSIIIYLNLKMQFNIFSNLILIIILFLLFNQIYKFNLKDKNRALVLFKRNNILGFMVFLNILIGKI